MSFIVPYWFSIIIQDLWHFFIIFKAMFCDSLWCVHFQCCGIFIVYYAPYITSLMYVHTQLVSVFTHMNCYRVLPFLMTDFTVLPTMMCMLDFHTPTSSHLICKYQNEATPCGNPFCHIQIKCQCLLYSFWVQSFPHNLRVFRIKYDNLKFSSALCSYWHWKICCCLWNTGEKNAQSFTGRPY